MDDGCIRDIHVPHSSGGVAVQIGCPADLSGIPDRNDGLQALVYNGERGAWEASPQKKSRAAKHMKTEKSRAKARDKRRAREWRRLWGCHNAGPAAAADGENAPAAAGAAGRDLIIAKRAAALHPDTI